MNQLWRFADLAREFDDAVDYELDEPFFDDLGEFVEGVLPGTVVCTLVARYRVDGVQKTFPLAVARRPSR